MVKSTSNQVPTADLLSETLILPSDVPKLMPARSGKKSRKAHLSSVYRWMTKGVCVNGRAIRLEFVQTPAGRFTSAPAVRRFLERLTAAAAGTPITERPTTKQRQRSIEHAREILRTEGV